MHFEKRQIYFSTKLKDAYDIAYMALFRGVK